MKQLWSPWRSHFIETHKDLETEQSPFTKAWNNPSADSEHYLLYRGEEAFIILNLYPYNAGHLLVVPVRQISDVNELTQSERYEMSDLTDLGIRILQRALKPDGFNVGMNIGGVAGAAIDFHLHSHIVPRWQGDTNFMPVLDQTRVISQEMDQIFARLIQARDEITRA